MSHCYKMCITYEGTNYSGWQIQPNALSIQSLIQQTLRTIVREEVAVNGSGRTDAGVHALGQIAHFTTQFPINLRKTLVSLNGILPSDIRILWVEEAPAGFHARYSAQSKTYHYHLHLSPIPDPFKKRYAYHVPHPVSVDTLRQAAAKLVGTHDFTSFANEPTKGSVEKNGIRTLIRLDVIEEPQGVRLEFEGTGFLYKMVRNTVGTLLEILQWKNPFRVARRDPRG